MHKINFLLQVHMYTGMHAIILHFQMDDLCFLSVCSLVPGKPGNKAKL